MIKFLDLQKINLAHKEEIEQAFKAGWCIYSVQTPNLA